MSADRQDMVVSHGGIHQGKPQQVLKDQKKKKNLWEQILDEVLFYQSGSHWNKMKSNDVLFIILYIFLLFLSIIISIWLFFS